MATYFIKEVWTSGNEWEHPKGGKLVSYFLTLADESRKVMVHQKPETPAPKEGDELKGEIQPETNQKGTHHRFKKERKFPDLECPCGCGYKGPLEDFRPRTSDSNAPTSAANPKQVPDSPPENKAPQNSPPVDESQAPTKGFEDISF